MLRSLRRGFSSDNLTQIQLYSPHLFELCVIKASKIQSLGSVRFSNALHFHIELELVSMTNINNVTQFLKTVTGDTISSQARVS